MKTYCRVEISRGDIYYADLRPVIGSEQGGIRPVLILQNNVGNRHSPTVIAAPITSKMGKPRLASPRHGTLTPGRISVGRPHCLIPISVGAVTGRKYHYPWRSHCDTACHRLFFGRMDPLSTLFGRR